MKKLFAMMLSLLLIGSAALTQPVYAEEAAPVEINWSDLEATVAESGIEGTFYTFDEIAIMMWVPDVLINTELTEEDVENGYIGYFQAEDESAAIGVQYVDVEGMTLDDYTAQLEGFGATEIEPAVINGLPAVSYKLEESDTYAVAFATEMGYIFETSFAPASDEGFAQAASLVAASIQPYEEDAEEGAEEADETEAAE